MTQPPEALAVGLDPPALDCVAQALKLHVTAEAALPPHLRSDVVMRRDRELLTARAQPQIEHVHLGSQARRVAQQAGKRGTLGAALRDLTVAPLPVVERLTPVLLERLEVLAHQLREVAPDVAPEEVARGQLLDCTQQTR